MPHSKVQGKYTIDLGQPDLEKKMASAIFSQTLDDTGSLRVQLALKRSDWNNIKGFAQNASFKWQNKPLFKGSLVATHILGHCHAELVYSDALYRTKKRAESAYLKTQSLQECLNNIVGRVDLRGRFHGDFSERLAAFGLSGHTLFEHLRELAKKYGFHFVTRPCSEQVAFVKVGSHVRGVDLSGQDDISDIRLFQSVEQALSHVTFRYFDASSMKTEQKHLTQGDLYGDLGPFSSHHAFNEKLGWKLFEGHTRTHVTNRHDFEKGPQRLKCQLSKQLMEQECVRVRCFAPLGYPGDMLSLKGAPCSRVQDGSYLVKSAQVLVSSCLPKMELYGIRP